LKLISYDIKLDGSYSHHHVLIQMDCLNSCSNSN